MRLVRTGAGDPSAVHRFAGKLFALCDQHRGGIILPDGRRTMPTEVEPKALQARLLDAYAVDPLPIDAVAWLCDQPPSPEPPAYFPSIRPVPR